jgi:hypothetical protein
MKRSQNSSIKDAALLQASNINSKVVVSQSTDSLTALLKYA